MLDDLFAASEPVEDRGRKPSIPFDYLAVADELHSGRIRVSGEAFTAEQREYREATLDPASEFAEILDQAERAAAALDAEQALPPADPVSIAAELRLEATSTVADFSRLRRSFAFSNHPDRVAPHLRQRAIERMQIANMLIDDARRKALAAAKR